ncbi:hypothetical protein MKW92_016475 [Papaver armeniacum]|nr:hypothetical protein MKW92_016475 [Papaver armeniacum]
MYNVVAELAYTMKVTEKCDVYSFGVIIFEVLMGRHPSEDIKLLSELLILSTTSKAMKTYRMLRDILDQRVGAPDNGVQKELVYVAKHSANYARSISRAIVVRHE